MKKKGNGKVEIKIKEGRKIVNNKELKLTPEFQEISDAINKLANYIKKNDITIVRDHCHFTGEFRGAAHNQCNRQFRKTFKIPVFFHNLAGYDGHFIFENLAKLKLKKAPTVIAKSLEKFISIKVGTVEFKDSLQFLNSSLDKLVNNLKDKGLREGKSLKETFPSTYEYFKRRWKNVNEDAFELLTRKGVYPYEYIDGPDRFQEREIPPKEENFSKLSGKHISHKDYEFAQEIWKTFKLKNSA
mgnify:CR=1 FL=1